MKFIASKLNGSFLSNILPDKSEQIDSVLAAVAYGSTFSNEENDLISNCLRGKWRLDMWMRYDHTVPVSIQLLKRFLHHHSHNIFLKLIPDCLHSKVIWWKGYGVYIGSANHTDRAWYTNIEAGVFMTDAELQASGMDLEFDNFFDQLRLLDKAFPVSDEIIREMERMERARAGIQKKGEEIRTVPVWEGPAFVDSKKADDRRKEAFRIEWHDALTTLRSIGAQIGDRRPSWMRESVPVSWQTDQCLHAYYYNRVGDSSGRPFEEFYQKHKANPSAATKDAIDWWMRQSSAPSSEDINLYEKAPAIRKYLAKDVLLNLTEGEFAVVCENTHSTWDHLTKMSLSTFGIIGQDYMAAEERVPIYAKWLLELRNGKGWSVLQLLDFVLYGGDDNSLWERLYLAARDSNYLIPHYGLNSIAEVVGWARPEVSPPRNGRTSKALRALGYDVTVY